jgi:hypothetical protein
MCEVIFDKPGDISADIIENIDHERLTHISSCS